MRVRVVVVARARRTPLGEAAEAYLLRCARHGGVELVRVAPAPDAGSRPERARADEARRLRERLPRGGRTVLLDERGEAWTSERLSAYLAGSALHGVADLSFVVGGAFGVDPSLRAHADAVVQLSAMTLPHELAMLVLCEQIYRAFTLWRGEPYHHP